MYTRCPACSTYFRIHAPQLSAASGKVRCGTCGEVFNALHGLYEELPTEADAPPSLTEVVGEAPVEASHAAADERAATPAGAESSAGVLGSSPQSPSTALPSGTRRLARDSLHRTPALAAPPAVPEPFPEIPADDSFTVSPPDADQAHAPAEPASEAPAEETLPMDIEAQAAEDLESFPEEEERHAPGRTLAWSLGAAVLLVLLAGQALYFRMDALAAEPRLRPYMERLCAVLDCSVPPLRDVGAVHLLAREVRGHPAVEGALLITATFVNNAPFPQPYPLLQVRLSDMDGKPVALRRFRPEEYLEGDVPAGGMQPDQPVQARLEVLDPGGVVSFQFDFL